MLGQKHEHSQKHRWAVRRGFPVGVLLIAVLFVPALEAEEPSATLADTQSWLKDKLTYSFEKSSVEKGKLAYTSAVVRWDDCTLILHSTNFGSTPYVPVWSSIDSMWRVPIGELDASIAKLEQDSQFPTVWKLTFPTRGQRKVVGIKNKVAWQDYESDDEPDKMLERFILTIDNRDLAERVLRAVTHASSLCGAPKEAF